MRAGAAKRSRLEVGRRHGMRPKLALHLGRERKLLADLAARPPARLGPVVALALVCTPWSLTCDRFVVPDPESEVSGASPEVMARGPGGSAPDRASRVLAKAIHAGRRGRDPDSKAATVVQLRHGGYAEASRLFSVWLGSRGPDAEAFGRTAVWLAALREG